MHHIPYGSIALSRESLSTHSFGSLFYRCKSFRQKSVKRFTSSYSIFEDLCIMLYLFITKSFIAFKPLICLRNKRQNSLYLFLIVVAC